MRRHEQSGFTLIEILVATAVATLLAVAGAQLLIPEYRSGLNDATVGEIYTIQEAAQTYFIRESVLPGGSNCANAINVLRSNDYLIGIDRTSPWGNPYTTRCTGTRFQVSTTIPDPYDNRALNSLVDATTTAAGKVTASVPRPDALDNGEYLSRTSDNPADRTMEKAILMDGNDLRDAGRITANTGDFDGRIDANSLYLHGGPIRTNGGRVRTVGGDILTGGGFIDTQSGRLETGGGRILSQGGAIDSGGGDLRTRGGDIDTNGGRLDLGGASSSDLVGVDSISMRNGVVVGTDGNRRLKVIADRIRTSRDLSVGDDLTVADNATVGGDIDVGGVIHASDVITDRGVRLSEVIQGLDILSANGSSASRTIRVPNCPSGMQPQVFAAPFAVAGGRDRFNTKAMGSIETQVTRFGNNYSFDLRVTDTERNFSHRPFRGFDKGIAMTRCVR